MKFKREKTGRAWGAALYPRYKTYGGVLTLPRHEYATLGGQVRCVIRARNWREVRDALAACGHPTTLYYLQGYWSVTFNPEECRWASTKPGTPFVGPLDPPQRDYLPLCPGRSR